MQAKTFFALEVITLLSTVCLLVSASIWATPAEEALDERHDAELLRAVISSMEKWRTRHRAHPRHKRAETNTCYGDLGCFDAKGPFSYLDMTPSPPDDIRTRFLMYPGKRAGRSKNLLDVPFENMTTAWEWADHGGFNKSLPTKVIVHGFGSSCTSVWVYEMRSALMSVEECNIICVDWEAGAVIPNYVRAAANTRLVGAQLARLLRGLHENSGLSLHNMHLIGFSLGAHVAGFTGTELGGNISRITGLDPAGPLFESQDPRARLDSSDAIFVDVIHSNGENLILGGLGSWQPMGHVDFYPNGGRMQKGCSNLFVGAVSDIIWSSAVEGRSLCNHRRAYKFFTDSVSPKCQFPAFPCDSYEKFLAGKCFPCTAGRQCGNMGFYADQTTARGQLYLITRDEEPFCAHQYHVKIESSPSEVPVVSYGKIIIAIIGESELNETFTMTHKDDAELVLGGSLSKILVPHPVLGEPTKIQISYIAYSGWLSSGLARWKIDKISFIDSFGRILSVCQKGLDLETGKSITLPLYKGDCEPSSTDELKDFTSKNVTHQFETDKISIRNETKNKFESYKTISNSNKFIPTPVIKIGNEAVNTVFSEDRKDDFEIIKNDSSFNIPWKPIDGEFFGENSLDEVAEEKESSRALNTRAVKKANTNSTNSPAVPIFHKEVVEPILKPNQLANKIARSHNINNIKIKHEISEPILVSTTSSKPNENVISTTSNIIYHKTFSSKIDNNDWIPTITSKTVKNLPLEMWNEKTNTSNSFSNKSTEQRNKKNHTNVNYRNSRNSYDSADHDLNLTFEDIEDSKNSNIISITVQLLPHRLANMLEQAERYARMTLLPLISAHTPKIFSDFVSTFTDHTPKYLPLPFKEIDFKSTENSLNQEHSTTIWNELIDQLDISNSINDTFAGRYDNDDSNIIESNTTTTDISVTETEIPKNNESLFIVYPVQTENALLMSTLKMNASNLLVPKSKNFSDANKTLNDNLNIGEVILTSNITEIKNESNKLYVNLPIYNETVLKTNTTSDKKPKYIPLNFETVLNNNTTLN